MIRVRAFDLILWVRFSGGNYGDLDQALRCLRVLDMVAV